MKSLVVGYGEIGQAVGAVIGAHDFIAEDTSNSTKTYDILHICIPYTKDFVKIVNKYALIYGPRMIIIYSTVDIGTTRQIPGAVHSPVEGKHPDLEMSIRFMERWVGYNDEDTKYAYKNFFSDLGLRVKMIPDSNYTEALKLLSTTEYGVNLVFADYKAKLAKKIGMDKKYLEEWNKDYNKLYRNLGMGDRFQKFVLTPPKGKIGGHCVVPNAKILQEIQPSPLVNAIIKMEIKK